MRRSTRQWLVAAGLAAGFGALTVFQLNSVLGPAIPQGSTVAFLSWWTASGASLSEFQSSYVHFLDDLLDHHDARAATDLAVVADNVGDIVSSRCPDGAVATAFANLAREIPAARISLAHAPPALGSGAAVLAYARAALPAIGQVSRTTSAALGVAASGLDLTPDLT